MNQQRPAPASAPSSGTKGNPPAKNPPPSRQTAPVKAPSRSPPPSSTKSNPQAVKSPKPSGQIKKPSATKTAPQKSPPRAQGTKGKASPAQNARAKSPPRKTAAPPSAYSNKTPKNSKQSVAPVRKSPLSPAQKGRQNGRKTPPGKRQVSTQRKRQAPHPAPPVRYRPVKPTKPKKALVRRPKQLPATNFSCIDDGFHRDPNDCSMFYRCNGRQRFYFACPPGLYFDEVHSTCTWPREAQPACHYRR